jgi:mannose-6-phosphate isomerase-like protein (cupin superfamily)
MADTLAPEGRAADVAAPADWPAAIREEFVRNQLNPCVGTELLSETDRVRVWRVHVRPGERLPFHRHVLDYFWCAVTSGHARSHLQDGRIIDIPVTAGQVVHSRYGAGEYKVHDLVNTGSTDLIFTTVEFLDSTNAPLPVPDGIRRRA